MELLNHKKCVFSASLPTMKQCVFQSGLLQFIFSSIPDDSSGCFTFWLNLELVSLLHLDIIVSVCWYLLVFIVVDFMYQLY